MYFVETLLCFDTPVLMWLLWYNFTLLDLKTVCSLCEVGAILTLILDKK